MPSTMRHLRALRPGRPSRQRRAVAVLELVLVIPILILPVLAIVRYGLYYANVQQVTLASRIGAEEASETAGLPTTSGAAVPQSILEAIDHQMATAGIDSYSVRLEHNVSGSAVELSSSSGTGDCGPADNLNAPILGRYVRLTICVPMTELVPQYSNVLGLGIWDGSDVVECTTVFRYEGNP